MRPGPGILEADDHLVAVAKPVGLATIAERDPARPHLRGWLEEELGRPVWVVHRIDKETSGVVLFALDATAHRELSLLFERRRVEKTYRACVHGDPGAAGTIDLPLRIFGSGRSAVDRSSGKPARTAWKKRATVGSWSELEVAPQTGRRHQIRAHLHAIGHPVVGDPLYGEAARRADSGRLMLHAEALALEFPGGTARRFTCSPPPDYALRVDGERTRT